MPSRLILGGARSGKSRHALLSANALEQAPTFIATAEPFDEEMAERIDRHKAERGQEWRTIEIPLDLVDALNAEQAQQRVCVVDCLTLWLSNLMHHERDVDAETERLCDLIAAAQSEIILVSNEVGLGIVPDTPLGRQFRDAQGRLNQAVAAVCDRVDFIAAGLALRLKG